MQKHVYPFHREMVEYLKGIFSLALVNKEAEAFDVMIDGLFVIPPTNDKEQINYALAIFNPGKNQRITVRFILRHQIVREYEYKVQEMDFGQIAFDEPLQVPGTEGQPETAFSTRPDLNFHQRTHQLGKEAALLLGAAIGAMDELYQVATDAADLADVRGQLLDSYEQRLEEQQQALNAYKNSYGKPPKAKPGILRTFNGANCAGIIINKSALKQAAAPLMELVRFFMGQSMPASKTNKPAENKSPV